MTVGVVPALNRALGAAQGEPFSLALLDEAVSMGVEEGTSLDWKRDLPRKEGGEDFAKHVAALANSGGGSLVYGVREEGKGSSAAAEVVGVMNWGDDEQRRLRHIAYSLIQPPVLNLTFHDASDGERTAVALVVPQSPDAPHLVWSKDRFIAPVRYGAQTVYMSEREIERAYRERFALRREREAGLSRHVEQMRLRLDESAQVWLICAAMPVQTRSPQQGRISRDTAHDVFMKALAGSPHLRQREDLAVNPTPLPGLRHWVTKPVDFGGTPGGLAALHDDGTVVYATPIRAVRQGEGNHHLHPFAVAGGVANAFWLASRAAQTLGMDSEYDLRVSMLWEGEQDPFFQTTDSMGVAHHTLNLPRVKGFIPIETTIAPLEDAELVRAQVAAVVEDVLAQGGAPFSSVAWLLS